MQARRGGRGGCSSRGSMVAAPFPGIGCALAWQGSCRVGTVRGAGAVQAELRGTAEPEACSPSCVARRVAAVYGAGGP
eukprot:14595028-Heterocapsa_arctica.AAC.1